MADPLDERVQALAAEAIEDLSDSIATQLAERLAEPVAQLVDELVRERLASIVEQLGGKALPTGKRSRAAAKLARPKEVAAKKAGSGPSCSKCGRTGHNARTCGKAAADEDEDDEEEEERVAIDQPPAPPQRTAAIAKRIASSRRNTQSTNDDDHRRSPPQIRPLKALPTGKLQAQPVALAPSCPHGNGNPAGCSQCVLGAARVTRVAIENGNVVVDGQVQRSLREHAEMQRPAQATRGAQVQRARKARRAA